VTVASPHTADGFPRARLVDAAVLAEHLGVTRDYVYEHKDELGVIKLGSGPRARLRFSLEEVDRRLSPCSGGRESEPRNPPSRAGSTTKRRRPLGTSGELLPIRGRIRLENDLREAS
jgi:hypothetical protein